jgi:hypothetical protein
LNLEHLGLVGRVHDLEGRLHNANLAVSRIKGRLRSLDQSIDLGFAQRRRLQVMAELAEARARERTLARELAPARDPYADIREREAAGLASFAALEKMVSGG